MAHAWQPAFDPQAGSADNLKSHAVHMALLPHGALGSVIYFSGNRWDGTNHNTGNVDHSALLDYASRTATPAGSPTGPSGLNPNHFYDLFCSGHALLADGRLLIGGGTSIMGIPAGSNPHEGHWGGLREAFAFDPNAASPWRALGLMNPQPGSDVGGGRWYPSLVTLADGSVLALCGHPRVYPPSFDEAAISDYPASEDDDRHNNSTPDRYSPSSDSWAQLNVPAGLGESFLHDYEVFYPRVHVLPGGKLLIVQPLFTSPDNGSIDDTGALAGKSLVYDPESQTVTASFPGPQLVDGWYLDATTAAQPTSSVLLPLLPETGYQVDILLCGGVQALRATFPAGSEAGASWVPTAARSAFFLQGATHVVPPRSHAMAVLLPTGDVFVSGGLNVWNNTTASADYDQTFGVRVPEIFSPTTGQWTALTDTPAAITRGYHSNALLMLDGRVLTAGSEINGVFGAGSAEFRMEVFEPDYISAPHRPSITSAPPSASYGESFVVAYAIAAGSPFPDISRVAAIRFGGATHAFNYDQRYVGLEFTQTQAGNLEVLAPPDPSIAPPGYYMLWLLDSGGVPCSQAATIRFGQQTVSLDFDRSVFSIYDVELTEDPATHQAVYHRAIYAVFDGFIPNEVMGLTPTLAISGTGVTASLSAGPPPNPALELSDSPQLIQRTVFAFDVQFDGTAAFTGMAGDDLRTLTVTLASGPWSATGTIELVMEPSPFILDGEPSYLSDDLRVFRVIEGNSPTWLPGHVWTGPTDYITTLVQNLNTSATLGSTMFGTISPLEASSALLLAPTTDGTATGPRVHNFAVARVRLRSAAVPTDGVRVMFRLFRTMTPSLVFDTATIFRRHTTGLDAIALLGTQGAELMSIPFFAHGRVTPSQNMILQQDPPNRRDMPAAPAEEIAYFGCWLDINQPDDHRFPANPGNATSFAGVPAGDLRSIQELVAGTHQCLVAEVHYKLDAAAPDLPRPGDTPATSDKLAQRNLALVWSANPGRPETRTVQHSFEIAAPAVATPTFATQGRLPPRRQGLCLWWDSLPAGSVVDTYLPGIAAADILALVPAAHAQTWQAVDGNTLRCQVAGEYAFLPLPTARAAHRVSGLLTARLPAGVRHGERHKIVARQFAPTGKLLGSFEVRIEINRDHGWLLARDKDEYAILQHSLSRLPAGDPWTKVLMRIVAQLRERIAAFGADPDSVRASPWGAGPHGLLDSPPNQGGSPQAGKKKSYWWVLLLIFVLLILMIVLFFWSGLL
ncbi:MAG TPA: galactose oxidase early set domain-containing protein [Allosphingosinicella sp.]